MAARKKPGAKRKFDARARGRYLDALRATGLVHKSADAAGVSGQCVRNHREADAEFERQVQDALETWREGIREQFAECATKGFPRQVYKGGRKTTIREMDPQTLYRYAKANCPEYQDRAQVEVHNQTPAVIIIPESEFSAQPLEDFAREANIRNANGKSNGPAGESNGSGD